MQSLFISSSLAQQNEQSTSNAAAQPAQPAARPRAPQPLIDRSPFDRITLDQANGGAKLEVFPLNLPQRPLASKPSSGTLPVRLLDRPAEDFTVDWAHVARVEVYEELLLNEALRLTAAGDFDGAFDYFAKLSAEYPALPGLDAALNDYLRRNALALYREKQFDRALALLLTLHKSNPQLEGIASAVETIAGEVIQQNLRAGDFAAARGVLDLWQTHFKGLAPQAAADWQRRFEAAAMKQVEECNRLMQAQKYVEARQAINKARAIWPQLPAANAAYAQIQREFPFVTVGVLEASPRAPKYRIDNWASLRTSRLTERLLAEQVNFGAEGGVYRSPFGELALDESGRALGLKLNPSPLTADTLARYLLAMAQPGNVNFRADYAGLLTGISTLGANEVQLQFNRVAVRPEAMLQIPPPGTAAAGDFAVAEFGLEQVVFTAADSAPLSQRAAPHLRAIVEQTFADDELAITALMEGDIDVLDRVPPWQLERVRNTPGLALGTYKLPTVHVLIPGSIQSLVGKREFRRALCYGIDRRWVLSSVILGGQTVAGYEVLSGPFPAGMSLSDPIRYGYNNRIAARPFEPRLAAVLAAVAWTSLNKPEVKPGENKEGEPAPPEPEVGPIPEITLAHPQEPLARVACQSMVEYLRREGIPVKLVEFTAEELAAGKVECDLRYAELAVWEPLADAREIVGAGGLAGGKSGQAIDTALRQLDLATNWNDVRARMAELHEVVYHELPVIPLWQTVNYFAYRTSVRGVGESPMTLYQHVEQWSAAQGEVASAQPSP